MEPENGKSQDELAQILANEIRSQESLHSGLFHDLGKIAAGPCVSEEEFHATFLKAMGQSGIETRLQNAVFHILRNKGPSILGGQPTAPKKKKSQSHINKVQQQWERRISKSLNSMASELGVCLAKPRCLDEQEEMLNKWTELTTLDQDLSPYRPVYSPKDFLEILAQVTCPNLADQCRPWGLIGIPFSVLSLDQLRERYVELAKCESHLGRNKLEPSGEDPALTLDTERYHLGNKVIGANHAPSAQEFLKKGAPHSLRGKLWSQVLGSEVGMKEQEHYQCLKNSVLNHDMMVDKLILKDVQITAGNDDNYFVFADLLLQILLCFSRDTEVLEKFHVSSSNPSKAILRGKHSNLDNMVIYPPNGVVPFHGFSMYLAPFCYVYDDPVQLYFTFRAFYLQFCYKLHEISSDPQGIVSLCALFERLIETHEPELWSYLQSLEIQPLRLVFRWIVRGFSGHLLPEQLLYLWDTVIAYDSMTVFPLLAASIISFRKGNLMQVDTLSGVEGVLADLSSLPVIPLLQLAMKDPPNDPQ